MAAPTAPLRRGVLSSALALVAGVVLVACGGAKPANGVVACSSASDCQRAMSRVVGRTVLIPHLAGMSFYGGFTAPKAEKDGFVGKIFYRNGPDPTVGFGVYGPGQIVGSDLGACSGRASEVITPKGRSVCWEQGPGGDFSARYVNGGLLYQISGSDRSNQPSVAQITGDRVWALSAVDAYA